MFLLTSLLSLFVPAVAGLPYPRDDHAVIMSRFANDCSRQMQKMCKALSKTLGPDTDDLGIRIGKSFQSLISLPFQ